MCKAFAAVVLACAFAGAARADIFRWDNGQTIPGTEGITPGPGVNLSGLQLDYANLESVDLTSANLSQANLTRARFNQATKLINASLVGTNLSDVGLSADFTGANFTDAVIDRGNFAIPTAISKEQLYATKNYQEGKLEQLSFFQVNLSGWSFANQSLKFTFVTDSNASNASFKNADLTNAWLRRTGLAGADFSDATINNAHLDEATNYGFTKEQLYATASYKLQNLSGVSLAFNDLSGWDFSSQRLMVSMAGSNVTGANFTNATVKLNLTWSTGLTKEQIYSTASYQVKDLQGIGLGSVDVRGWDLRGQNLAYSSFAEARLTDADFAGANITGVQFGNTTSRGFTKEQLYSTATYLAGTLGNVGLSLNNLAGWDLHGQDLRRAEFGDSNLTGANFTGAIIDGAYLGSTSDSGFTKEQLYSTASYQMRSLSRVDFSVNALDGWNFADQDLTRAAFVQSKLQGTDFSRADLRGARGFEPVQANIENAILPDGVIHGLALDDGESLRVLDYDGSPFAGFDPNIAVHIEGGFNMAPTSALRLVLGPNTWDSTISFEPGLDVELNGILRLEFAPGMHLGPQLGRTFQLFDWTDVQPQGVFQLSTQRGAQWDLSQLYTTGQVTLVGVPEPTGGTIALIVIAALGWAGCRKRGTV